MSVNERRGFFDECHWGEIDPGYVDLVQSGTLVAEAWISYYQIDILFFPKYVTPGKPGNPPTSVIDFQTKSVPPTTLAVRMQQLTAANASFTHVRYAGNFIKHYGP